MNTIGFLLGISMKVLDEIYDAKILVEYTAILEFIVISLLIYGYVKEKYTSFIISLSISLFCVFFTFYSPVVIENFAWKIGTLISYMVLIYHLYNYRNLVKDLTEDDVEAFKYSIIPLIFIFILTLTMEDYLFPEERGTLKLASRSFVVLLFAAVYYMLNFTGIKNILFYNSDKFISSVNFMLFFSSGYCITSVLFLTLFSDIYDT